MELLLSSEMNGEVEVLSSCCCDDANGSGDEAERRMKLVLDLSRGSKWVLQRDCWLVMEKIRLHGSW